MAGGQAGGVVSAVPEGHQWGGGAHAVLLLLHDLDIVIEATVRLLDDIERALAAMPARG
jgi:hypothetical protein